MKRNLCLSNSKTKGLAVVKLMTNRLMNIFISYSILQGYNFTALLHSSTFEPLHLIDNILYDIKKNHQKV